jgi:hypothetical protein
VDGHARRAHARGHSRPLVFHSIYVVRAQALAIAAGLALLVGAATLGFTPLNAPKGTRGTSALWLLPAPDGLQAACVGVINEQLHAMTYDVSVSVAGEPVTSLGPITLTSGERWTRELPVDSPTPVIVASLRTSTDPSVVYRRVALRHWNIAASSC